MDKYCPRCNQTLSSNKFYNTLGRRGSGLSGYCKQCTVRYVASRKLRPIIISVLEWGDGVSLQSIISKDTRHTLSIAKGLLYVYTILEEKYYKYPPKEQITFTELCNELQSNGYSIKEVRWI